MIDQANFKAAFEVFFAELTELQEKRCKEAGYTKKTYGYTIGKKYIRVVEDDARVFLFVDKTTGNILKPAGWKAPAKHARGNIFDDTKGLGQVGLYGPAYLRG